METSKIFKRVSPDILRYLASKTDDVRLVITTIRQLAGWKEKFFSISSSYEIKSYLDVLKI
jgi:hypothetical protein